MKKVSAVIPTRQISEQVKKVVADLKQFPFIDDIILADEEGSMYKRYTAMKRARHDLIYTQDDDCIVDVKHLYGYFDGTKLVNGMKPERAKHYAGRDTLVGWGAFLDRRWTQCFDEYMATYGVDEILQREADRIFTCLCPASRITVITAIADLPSAMSPGALSLQADHERSRRTAVERCEKLIEARKVAS